MTQSPDYKRAMGSSNRASLDAHPNTPQSAPQPTDIPNSAQPQAHQDPPLIEACFTHFYAPFPRAPRKKEVLDTFIELLTWSPQPKKPVVQEYEPPLLDGLKSFLHFLIQSIHPSHIPTPLGHPVQSDLMPKNQSIMNPDLQAFLAGRLLLLNECQAFTLQELKQHTLDGQIHVLPGITHENGGPFCQRCANQTPHRFAEHQCARCGQVCLYCRECLEMGQVRECSILLKWVGQPPETVRINVECQWAGTLTPEQHVLSDHLLNAVHQKEDFLVWAVCGAGKTEVLFKTIQALIQAKKRVAIAAPRTDVILELDERMARVFPDVPRVALYADTPTPYQATPFVLTTLHQLRRFDRAFDLIIIDEVDAFPFHGNQSLDHVLKRALKSNGSRVFVTATPTRSMKSAYLKGRLNGGHLPIRFHRAPLPEPTFRWVGNWRDHLKKNQLPPTLYRWLAKVLQTERRVFVFVPEIQLVDRLTSLLKSKGMSAEGSHSEDPNRREKVLAFREGRHSIMVTTTILERGVTIPFADVAVLGAETALYDERALVQMAGRSGRDARNPTGEVIFFHHGKTLDMLKARAHIRFMNQEAARLEEN